MYNIGYTTTKLRKCVCDILLKLSGFQNNVNIFKFIR